MAEKIKILLLDTNDAGGGVVTAHLLLLRTLDRAQIDVHLACLGHGSLLSNYRAVPETTLWTIEVGTKSSKWCGGWRGRLVDALTIVPLVFSAVRLSFLCRRAGIQVIHTSDKKRSLLLTLLLHRLTGLPYLYHIHSQFVDYPANRIALRKAAMIIANSRAARQEFIAHLGPPMECIRLVYNGVDTNHFFPAPDDRLRREIGAAPDDVLIGIIGRLAPDKGQETFLQAAARVAAEEPRTRFVIIGDDAIFCDNAGYAPQLRRLANEGALANRVSFLGFRHDVASLTRGLDMVVNASWREAFGLVVVEGMACAKPAVCAEVGGVPEIITHGRNGFLFPARDEQRLAEILLELVRQPDLRQRIGDAARQTVLECFSVQKQVRAIEQIYGELATA